MIYAVSTSRVIFTAKTSLDLFNLGRKQVWTFSVLRDQISAEVPLPNHEKSGNLTNVKMWLFDA